MDEAVGRQSILINVDVAWQASTFQPCSSTTATPPQSSPHQFLVRSSEGLLRRTTVHMLAQKAGLHQVLRPALTKQEASCADMSLSLLNEDVVSAIVSFIAPSDSLRFGKTCRSAYAAVIPKYLSDVTIKDAQKQLPGFCAFVLAERDRRPGCLRRLVLNLDTSLEEHSASSAQVLANTLRGAVGLRTLNVGNIEGLLACAPSLGNTLASLPGLQHISFQNVGRRSYALLMQMVSCPRHLHLDTFCDYESDNGEYTLDKFTHCLETVEISRPSVFLDFPPSAVWPLVTVLNISYIGEYISLARIACAFPNLRCLKFRGVTPLLYDSSPHWASLDVVETDLPIELSSRVRRLVLRSPYERNSTHMDRLVLAMLQHASPVVLSCQVHPDAVAQIPSIAPDLKYLQITVRDQTRGSSTESRSLAIVHALGKLPLVALSFCHGDRWTTAPECDVERLRNIAKQVVIALPTLEHIGFDSPFAVKGYNVRRWFYVTNRSGDVLQLHLLSQHEVDALDVQLAVLDRSP